MRTRNLTLAFMVLGLTACVALEPQSASTESVITTGPLAAQSAVAWPPRALADQAQGEVPDFTAKNETCLDCHKEILAVKSARPDISNLHVLHLQSKKTAYKGDNRDCLSCHEMVASSESKARKKEGWFAKGDVYHPNVMLAPEGVWKKLIVRPGVQPTYGTVEALRTADPYTFKPTLKRLVCVECHGQDSKIKTFYGAPSTAK